MFDNGKNNDPDTLPIGTAFIGYDAGIEILCAAAHLDADYDSKCQVVENNDKSFVEFGGDTTTTTRLKQSESSSSTSTKSKVQNSRGHEASNVMDVLCRLFFHHDKSFTSLVDLIALNKSQVGKVAGEVFLVPLG